MYLGLSHALNAVRRTFLPWIKDNLKLYFDFNHTKPTHLLAGSTEFDGSDDVVTTSADSTLTDATYTFWAKSDVTGANHGLFGHGQANMCGFHFNYSSNRPLLYCGGARYKYWNDTPAQDDGQWHHWAIVFDSDNMTNVQCYVDGQLLTVNFTSNTGAFASYSEGISIGADRASTGNHWEGSLAHFEVHHELLTQSQIQSIMWKNYGDLSPDEKTNLVSWWSLANDFTDSHGSNHGTANGGVTAGTTPYGGASPIKPRIQDNSPDALKNYGTIYSGTCLDFDGTNDRVDVPESASFTPTLTSNLSMSFWISPDDLTTEQTLIGFRNGQNDRWTVQIVSNQIVSNFFDSSPNTASGVIINGFHHVVLTWDTATPKLYIDGDLQTGTTIANHIVGADNVLYIGADNATTYPFDGKISNPLIYDVALTETQIQELYLNPETVLPSGVSASNLKLWLPFQEGSGTVAYDGSGNGNHGTITGATWSKGNADIFQTALVRQNKPMVFDSSSNNYIDTNFSFSSTNHTISIWVKYEGTGVEKRIVDIRDANDDGIFFSIDSSQQFFYALNTSDITSSAINENEWNHAVITYDGTTQKLYVNGSLSNSATTSQTVSTSVNAIIGGKSFSTQNNNHNGLINEVAIWNEAITSDEITALYNGGTPLDASADSGDYVSSANLVGYWRNDGDTTWTDRSTNSNDGTVSGSPSTILLPEGNTSGRDSQGFYLNNTDEKILRLNGAEYVDAGDKLLASATVATVEAWVKTNAIGSQQGIVGEYKSGNKGFISAIFTNGKVKFYDTSGNFYSTTVLSANTWYHVAISFEGGTAIKFYINGVLDSTHTTAIATSLINVTASNTAIGDIGGGASVTLDGDIDEARIYSKALSADEVLKNYNHGKSKHQ